MATSSKHSTVAADITLLGWATVALFALILLSCINDSIANDEVKGARFLERPCEEIYVVGEGETLHTISEKCGDPYIVERNPHIHDPDDVFPGLVIKIMPAAPYMLSSTRH